jgi:hypothetical protein
MKLSKKENKSISDAIDQVQEGLNTFIEMYNESEEDQPFISFDEEVITGIEKARRIFGDDFVNKKINALVKEVISFLPLDDYEEVTEDENKAEG